MAATGISNGSLESLDSRVAAARTLAIEVNDTSDSSEEWDWTDADIWRVTHERHGDQKGRHSTISRRTILKRRQSPENVDKEEREAAKSQKR